LRSQARLSKARKFVDASLGSASEVRTEAVRLRWLLVLPIEVARKPGPFPSAIPMATSTITKFTP